MNYMGWLKFYKNFFQTLEIKNITLAPMSIMSLFLGSCNIYIDKLNSFG